MRYLYSNNNSLSHTEEKYDCFLSFTRFFQEKDMNGGSKWYLYFLMETFFALKILSFERKFKALVHIIVQKFYGNNNFSFCL